MDLSEIDLKLLRSVKGILERESYPITAKFLGSLVERLEGSYEYEYEIDDWCPVKEGE